MQYRLKANRFHLWFRCVKKMIDLKLKRKLGMASNGFFFLLTTAHPNPNPIPNPKSNQVAPSEDLPATRRGSPRGRYAVSGS